MEVSGLCFVGELFCLHVYRIVLWLFFCDLTMEFSIGAIPSDEQIRLTPSMTNKKGIYLYIFVEQSIDCLVVCELIIEAFK